MQPRDKVQLFIRPVKLFAWLIAFAECSYLVSDYEALMNAGGNLSASGLVSISGISYTTNLYNEGVIGYASLALTAFCAFMFVFEAVNAAKAARRLSDLLTSGQAIRSEPEVKNFV